MTATPESASTVAEFCTRHRINKATLYRMAKRGELRLTRYGQRMTRILASDEADWLARCRAGGRQG